MKLPAMETNKVLPNTDDSSFDFDSKLRFQADSNLLRSRSDTLIRYGKKHSSTDEKTALDAWSVSPVDFSLHRYQTKLHNAVTSLDNRRKLAATREDKQLVKGLPKVLERQNIKAKVPFVTTCRLQSAGAAKRCFVKHGMYRPGYYKTPGPHAFRGDDFRPISEDILKEKPPFTTTFATDPGNLGLKRQGIGVINKCEAPLTATVNEQHREYVPRHFLTSTNQRPRWEKRLILQKEAYKRGISEEEIRMHQIIENLSWCPRSEATTVLHRPDTKDYKTIDWLQVTRHPVNEKTIIH